jgi:hypothetical protein
MVMAGVIEEGLIESLSFVLVFLDLGYSWNGVDKELGLFFWRLYDDLRSVLTILVKSWNGNIEYDMTMALDMLLLKGHILYKR